MKYQLCLLAIGAARCALAEEIEADRLDCLQPTGGVPASLLDAVIWRHMRCDRHGRRLAHTG